MSKINNFVTGLVASASSKLNKNLLLKDLDSTISITREIIQPSTQTAVSENAPEFKTKWAQTRNQRFNKAMGLTKTDTNMFVIINPIITRVIGVLEELKDYFEKKEEVKVEGLNYQTATAMQLYYVARWYIDFSKDFLLLLYTNEMQADLENDRSAPPFTKAEVEEIENRFELYIQFSQFFGKNMKESVTEYLIRLPESEVTEDGVSVIETMMRGKKVFDIPDTRETKNFLLGPSLFVASIVAQVQEQRYQSAVMEQKSVNLRILQVEQLKYAAESGGDTGGRTLESIEKELDYNNKRLRDIRKRVEAMEKKYEL